MYMKILTVFFLLAISLPASATTLLPLSLEQLSSRAALIFYAEVTANEVLKDPQSGQIVTLTTFRVLDLIKGQVNGKDGSTHTIKQLGGVIPGQQQRLMVHGIPGFVSGRQYVVFLPEPSRLGFCSPLGLHQGSFAVIDNNGTQLVSNGNALAPPVLPANARTTDAGPDQRNTSLPLAVVPGRPSQAQLRSFIDTVRNLQQATTP